MNFPLGTRRSVHFSNFHTFVCNFFPTIRFYPAKFTDKCMKISKNNWASSSQAMSFKHGEYNLPPSILTLRLTDCVKHQFLTTLPTRQDSVKTVIRSIIFTAIISEHYESVRKCVAWELELLAEVDPELNWVKREKEGEEEGWVLFCLPYCLPFLKSAISFTQNKGGPGPTRPLPLICHCFRSEKISS